MHHGHWCCQITEFSIPNWKLFPWSLILGVISELFSDCCIYSEYYLLPSLDRIIISFIMEQKLKRSILAEIWSIWFLQRSDQFCYKISSKRWQWSEGEWVYFEMKGFDCSFHCYSILNSRQPDATTLISQ